MMKMINHYTELKFKKQLTYTGLSVFIIFGALNLCNPIVEPEQRISLTLSNDNGSVYVAPNKLQFNAGEFVTLEAIPDCGFLFLNWSGDTSGTQMSMRLEMNCNKNIIANFVSTTSYTVSDIDENKYHIVRIGNQVWTTSNYRVTRLNNGHNIKFSPDSIAWASFDGSLSIDPNWNARYCYYNNSTDQDTITKYGALYNKVAVVTGKLAPQGWHVSTSKDWDSLKTYLAGNGFSYDGEINDVSVYTIGKSLCAQTDWHYSEMIGAVGNEVSSNNKCGFSALPGGLRSGYSYVYNNMGEAAYFWSTTDCWELHFDGTELTKNDGIVSGNSRNGYSVRLVKD